MAIEYGSREALERRISAQRLVQMFDDDGDGAIANGDLDTLEEIMGAASDVVTGLLLHKGFTAAQLEIIKSDRQVVHAWAGIAAQLAGERKTEWLDDNGQGPYDALGKRGRDELKALATGAIRSVQEATAGANPAVSGANSVRVNEEPFIFNPNPRDYGSGGRGPGGF